MIDRINALEQDVAAGTLAAALPPAPVAPHVQPDVFVSNPYQADLNSSTSNGLKMYQTAVKARETRLNARIKNKKECMDAMKPDFVSIGCGSVISNVTVGNETYNILVDVQTLDEKK